MIDDEELRHIYKVASEERLQKLDAGLLHLEKHPDDQEPLEELLREAHSLKGDSRMLGVGTVEKLIHQFEHSLGGVKRGEETLTPNMCDRLWQGLDAIRKLVHEAVTGDPANVDTFHVLAQMMGADPPTESTPSPQAPTPETTAESQDGPPNDTRPKPSPTESLDVPEVIPDTLKVNVPQPQVPETAQPAPVSDTIVETVAPNGKASGNGKPVLQKTPPKPKTPTSHLQGEPYRIETIRVETRNLDALMTQSGELTVTKIRVAHRLSEIEELTALWEEWSRDSFTHRFILEEISGSQAVRQNLNGQFTRLQNFHRRIEERQEQLGKLIHRLRNSAYEDTARLEVITDELEEGIRTLRLLPLSTIFSLFPRMVRDLARQQDKDIDLIIEGAETRADKRILEEMKDPIMHILRNCVDHGIETPEERERLGKPKTAKIILRGYQTSTNVILEIQDDGKGLDIEKIKRTAIKRGLYREEDLETMTPSQIHALIFAPGFSTRTFVTEVSGRGVGLDVVRTNVERLKGSIEVDSQSGQGTTFRIQLGTTLATAHVLLVAVDGRTYAIPVEFVETTRLVAEHDIFTIEGREAIFVDNQPISIAYLRELLELNSLPRDSALNPQDTQNTKQYFCIMLRVGQERLGLMVDSLIDEQDVVLKPQSKLLKRVRNVAGATILGTGEVCMILNPPDFIKSVQKKFIAPKEQRPQEKTQRKQLVLLAEDSIATRTQEKRILEAAGYEVVTAVDGLDAFDKLKTRSFDAVVSDVQMPNLDGLGLVQRIRQHSEYNELPVILVTSLASDEDKRRGAEAGANAYITKGAFNQDILLSTLNRLI
ncbi:MAG: hybrid sensor histidine kinase/response regulator [Chroococcales cyanobacterium]